LSNNESFIDEVTEEVRRDKLFALFRRYGWIGVLLVVGIVGGAAWTEWQKAQTTARAESFGDAVTAALTQATPDARIAALKAVPSTADQAGLLQLMLASDPEKDRKEALAALDAVAADTTLDNAYRDLAVLRRTILVGAEAPVADRRTALEGITAPGRPYRTLAQEQLAYLLVEEGKAPQAIDALRALTKDQDASQGLRARAEQVILALGGAATAEG
jgi:hypothetical protein